jgi:hypothetical protein
MNPVPNDQSKADRFLLAVLAVSLIANLGLLLLLRQSHGVAAAFAKNHISGSLLPPVGARLDELHFAKIGGGAPDLKLDSHELPIVVYVLSPTCKWCKLNKPIIDSLATQLQGKYRFIGISITSKDLAAYVAENSPTFPVYKLDPGSSPTSMPLSGTPETLVFSPDGLFLRGWNGAYIGGTREQVSSYFGVKLPG